MSGPVSFDWKIVIANPVDDFVQPLVLWNYWDETEKEAFISNVSNSLKLIKNLIVLLKQRMLLFRLPVIFTTYICSLISVFVFYKVSPDIGQRIYDHIVKETHRTDLPPWTDLNFVR